MQPLFDGCSWAIDVEEGIVMSTDFLFEFLKTTMTMKYDGDCHVATVPHRESNHILPESTTIILFYAHFPISLPVIRSYARPLHTTRFGTAHLSGVRTERETVPIRQMIPMNCNIPPIIRWTAILPVTVMMILKIQRMLITGSGRQRIK